MLVLLLPSTAFCSGADIDYVEGEAWIAEQLGDEYDAQIGDHIETGDTVNTASDGYVELAQQDTIIKISSDTVFSLREKVEEGAKTDVFACVLGSAQFKIKKLTGRAPEITSNSCAAGVRGTEFTLYAGADGSSLIVVTEGRVAVQAAGKAVELAAEEGVEVELGQPPGEKFKVHRDQIDYQTWNNEKLSRLTTDPLGSIERFEQRLNSYLEEIDTRFPVYREYTVKLAREKEKLKQIEEKEGKEARTNHYRETVFPLEVETTYMYLNIRYFSLASLSLRRYVLGRMYLLLKAQYMATPQDAEYLQFLSKYQDVLHTYEEKIVPYLVEADL